MLTQQVCVKQAKGRWGRVESNGLECPSSPKHKPWITAWNEVGESWITAWNEVGESWIIVMSWAAVVRWTAHL